MMRVACGGCGGCVGDDDGVATHDAGRRWFFAIMVLAVCVLQVATAHAAPPAFVYVVSDQLTPDKVFANGIPAPGTDDDVIAHVNGKSCAVGRSGFVSTTASEAFAHERVLYLLMSKPRAVVYVYRIRADSDVYGIDLSFNAMRYRKTFPQLATLAGRMRHQEEWVAHRGLRGTQVVEALSYGRNAVTDTIEFRDKIDNVRYVGVDTTASAATLVVTLQDADRTRYLTPSFSSVSACFACLADGGNADNCDVFTVPADRKPVQVIDPLNDTKTWRYVPWEAMRRTSNYAVLEGPAACEITPGTSRADVLTVNCARLEQANRFAVQLGAGGRRATWVSKRFDGGNVSGVWARTPKDIPVTGTGSTLHDYGYSIAAVFSGADISWWANVTVMPVYPPLPRPTAEICLFGPPRPIYALGCKPSNVMLARLPSAANDIVHSIAAAPAQRYQVCEHWDFAGRCAILRGSADAVSLKRLGLSERISSIKACNKPMPGTWQPYPGNRGLIGSIYAYDRPQSGQREFYQLRKSIYGPLPASARSNADWTYLRDYAEC